MRTVLLYALTICSVCSLWAQQKYENGYYIDNSGKRTDIMIRTTDLETLNDKDAKLEVRVSVDAASQEIPVLNIAEVGIANDTKLKRFDISLDDENYFRNDNTEKYVRFEKRRLFLNVLIEGEASLYTYDSGRGTKYFYRLKSQNGQAPQQFIYKTYSEGNSLKENNEFRQQLFNDLKCDGDGFSKFANLKYDRDTFLRSVDDYNKCHGGEAQTVFKNDKKSKMIWGCSVFGGVHIANAHVSSNDSPSGTEARNGFSFGIEEEFLMPTLKWAFLAKLEFEKFKMRGFSKKTKLSEFTDDIQIDEYSYKTSSVNFLLGGRRYFMPESKHRIYVDGMAGMTFPSGSSQHLISTDTGQQIYSVAAQEYKNMPNLYFSVGLGYSFSRKISAEVRFDSPKVIVDENFFTLGYTKLGANLRYTF